jgi:hypothetical protein
MSPAVNPTRRAVLGAGLGLAGVAVIAGAGGLAGLLGLDASAHLVEASYRPLLGRTFQVLSPRGADLRLVGVRNLGALSVGRRRLTGREHFALDFEGPAGNRLGSSLYQLSHPDLGRFQLFLAPVGLPGSVQRYEAIINRFEINTRRKIDV